MDITYLPMARGFGYLAVVLDWASQRILAWRVSNSLTADCCVEALEEAYSPFVLLRYSLRGSRLSSPGTQANRTVATLP